MNTSPPDGPIGSIDQILGVVKGKHVCCDCVDEAFLKYLVHDSRAAPECHFCGARSRKMIAAPLEKVVEKVAIRFERCTERSERARPIDASGPFSTVEVLQRLKWTKNEGLVSYVADALERGHEWKWWNETPDPARETMEVEARDLLDWSWCRFTDSVMYTSRFNFLTAPKPLATGMVCAKDVLSRIGELVIQRGLVKPLPGGQLVYRARTRQPLDSWNPGDEEQLRAPPREKAGAGRMNPAGIPPLYTALDEETVLREVVPSCIYPPVSVVQAKFRTKQVLTVLDLTELPLPPSQFDDEAQTLDDPMYFLSMFSRDISLQVEKDGAEHIDYVPTQVVAEYLSQVFEPNGPDSHLHGLMYRSAARLTGKNLVLFPGTHPIWTRRFDSLVRLVDWRVRQLEGRWELDSPTPNL